MNGRPQNELYFSTDIEADGPVPLRNSLLSIGAAAFTLKRGVIDQFEVNLELTPGATADPDTMAWWSKYPDAWVAARRDPLPLEGGITRYCQWVLQVTADCGRKRPVFAAYPAGFDFTWIYVYANVYFGSCPFGFKAWDAQSYASAVLKQAFRDTVKSKLPAAWFAAVDCGLSHRALDDALSQAEIFMRMMRANLAGAESGKDDG